MAYVILIIVIAVLAVAGGGYLLVRPRRSAVHPARPPESAEGGGAQGTAVLDRTEAPAAPTVTAPAPPAAPEIEKPPPSAGRLAALRGRLARSQSGLGSVLLNLLSRSTLDDQTWEEIEDALITADVGVTPARQITDELKTKMKVAGSRDAGEAKALLRAELLAQVNPDL